MLCLDLLLLILTLIGPEPLNVGLPRHFACIEQASRDIMLPISIFYIVWGTLLYVHKTFYVFIFCMSVFGCGHCVVRMAKSERLVCPFQLRNDGETWQLLCTSAWRHEV